MINIDKKENCCGCTACMSICPKKAIKMCPDEEGFLYPKIDEKKCIHCGLCEKVCPILNKNNNNSLKIAKIVRAKDNNVLKQSTSGGFFTPLSEYFIDNDGFVFGALFEKNKIVHKGSNRKDILKQFRGSKYVQSDLNNSFIKIKKILDDDKYVLFSGTPCQVSGLKQFLMKDYEKLITVDVICHGTPSPLLFKHYVEYMERRYESKIRKISFRNKTYGYHVGTMKIEFKNGKIYYGSARTDFMLKSFFEDISSRPSCYNCNFKNKNHVSDFTIYDCWHASKINSDIIDDDKGYTNLIINSKKGKNIFELISDDYEVFNSDFEKAVDFDGIMVENNAKKNIMRDEFYKELNRNGIENAVQKYIPITKKDYFVENTKPYLYKLGLIKIAKKIKILLKR